MNPILENRPSEPPLHESESSATLDQPLQRPERSTLPPAKYEILAEIIEDDNTGEWRNIQPGQEKYESAEHMLIGESITLRMVNNVTKRGDQHELVKIQAAIAFLPGIRPAKVYLKFGQIIALAGDFYTTYSDSDASPICGAFFNQENSTEAQKERFTSAVDSLLQDSDRSLKSLVKLINEEKQTVVRVSAETGQVAVAYNEHAEGISTTVDYTIATLNSKASLLGLYAYIAWVNADHFGNDAETVYCVGHELALEFANKAARESNPAEQQKLLNTAYIYEAFACHYLTDLFSSGHNRVPRRQLHSSSKLWMAKAGISDTPVWDNLSRMCHDDDNATGLLVRNRNGDEWIMFGDKEYLSPQNSLNRARVIHCVQAAVDEVFDKGFRASEKLDRKDYIAMRLLPIPMVSVEGSPWVSEWGGADKHNPAPLWKAVYDADQEVKSWTCRASYNDHSDFGDRQQASADWSSTFSLKGSPQGEEMKAAAFCGKDQFPKVEAVQPDSGGFVQIQQLDDGPGDWQCVNIWGPVSVGGKKTFTLRNRIIDFYRHGKISQASPLHWLKWFDGSNTILVRLDLKEPVAGGQEGAILASSWVLESKQADKSKQMVDFDPNRSWAFTAKKLMDSNPLVKNFKGHYADTNYTRYLLTRITAGPQSQPDLVAVAFHSETKARISIMSGSNGFAKSSMSMDTEFDVGFIPWGFVKQLRRLDGSADILIATAGVFQNERAVRLNLFSRLAASSLSQSTSNFKLPAPEKNWSVSIMTGDVFHQRRDQVVVMMMSQAQNPEYRLLTYGRSTEDSALSPSGQHTCKSSTGKKLIRNYLTALMPAESSTPGNADPTNPGLDVLHISLQQSNENGAYVLVFHTHRRTSEPPALESQRTWDKCVESEVPDDFYHRYVDGTYFSIKWIRCEHDRKKNAIMEVFSWYGVLGVRVFSPIGGNGRYVLVGKQPYMGQTSIAMGQGCYGDWGYGIMTWGPNEDFVDSNVWGPKSATDFINGDWGMAKTDYERRVIRGWDVRKRQQRV